MGDEEESKLAWAHPTPNHRRSANHPRRLSVHSSPAWQIPKVNSLSFLFGLSGIPTAVMPNQSKSQQAPLTGIFLFKNQQLKKSKPGQET
jgi:hypothetical protein